MRNIEVEHGLKIKFPDRNQEFDDGVEIGIFACALSTGASFVYGFVAPHNVEPAVSLAETMGYRLMESKAENTIVRLHLTKSQPRTALRLVHSRERPTRRT